MHNHNGILVSRKRYYLRLCYLPAFSCYYRENTLHSLCAIYIGHFTHAGIDIFWENYINQFTVTISNRKSIYHSFTYIGLEINHQSDTIEVSQKGFFNSLSFIPLTQQECFALSSKVASKLGMPWQMFWFLKS